MRAMRSQVGLLGAESRWGVVGAGHAAEGPPGPAPVLPHRVALAAWTEAAPGRAGGSCDLPTGTRGGLQRLQEGRRHRLSGPGRWHATGLPKTSP